LPRQAAESPPQSLGRHALLDLHEGRVWVAAREVCGRDGAFRDFLGTRQLPYAVTLQANQTVLPRLGWRHATRLVERRASRPKSWDLLPSRWRNLSLDTASALLNAEGVADAAGVLVIAGGR
jgi:hypothetical protein